MVVPVRSSSSSSSSLSKLRTPFGLCLLLFVLLLLLIVRVLLCPAFPTAADNMNAFYLSRRQVQDDRVEPPATNNFAATVAITTADGTVHETIIPVPSGEARQSRLQLSCAKPIGKSLLSLALSLFPSPNVFKSKSVTVLSRSVQDDSHWNSKGIGRNALIFNPMQFHDLCVWFEQQASHRSFPLKLNWLRSSSGWSPRIARPVRTRPAQWRRAGWRRTRVRVLQS